MAWRSKGNCRTPLRAQCRLAESASPFSAHILHSRCAPPCSGSPRRQRQPARRPWPRVEQGQFIDLSMHIHWRTVSVRAQSRPVVEVQNRRPVLGIPDGERPFACQSLKCSYRLFLRKGRARTPPDEIESSVFAYWTGSEWFVRTHHMIPRSYLVT